MRRYTDPGRQRQFLSVLRKRDRLSRFSVKQLVKSVSLLNKFLNVASNVDTRRNRTVDVLVCMTYVQTSTRTGLEKKDEARSFRDRRVVARTVSNSLDDISNFFPVNFFQQNLASRCGPHISGRDTVSDI